MKTKTLLLATLLGALTAMPAFGALTLTASFTLTQPDGSDPEGFVGSTWAFTFVSSQTNYSNVGGVAGVVSDSVSLTVSGATNNDYNGTFALTETTTTNFLAFPNAGGNTFAWLATSGAGSTFTFGTPEITVSGFGVGGTSVADPAPAIGAPILASDFDGAMVSDGFVNVGGNFFSFGTATLNAVVPEPSTYAALTGLTALGFVAWRRRKS